MCKYCDRFPVKCMHGTEGCWNEYFSKKIIKNTKYDKFACFGKSLENINLDTYYNRNKTGKALTIEFNWYPKEQPKFCTLGIICTYKDITLCADIEISYCPFCGKKLNFDENA